MGLIILNGIVSPVYFVKEWELWIMEMLRGF